MPFDSTPTESRHVTIMKQIRNEIAAGKWCKGALEDFRGNRCIVGWWEYFDTNLDDDEVVFLGLSAAPLKISHPIFNYLPIHIMEINDSRQTTKYDMVKLLDEAIEKAQSLCGVLT